MDKKQKEAQRRQEDIALTRGLMWVGAAIVLEALLLLVNRYYISFAISTTGVKIAELIGSLLRVIRIGGAVAAVAAIVWLVLRLRKGEKVLLPVLVSLACGALTVCSHVALVFSKSGMQMLLMLVPAWAGLALVFYIYQREFFLGAVASGLSILGLWFVRYGGVGLEAVLCAVGVLVVAAAVLWLKKNNGKIKCADGSLARVMSKKTSYPMILASCGVGLAAMLLAMVVGSGIAYYLIFAMIAWLFALLVYYTVKLM